MFCLEHRSYAKHQCPKGNINDVTVVICPLCAKGVRLVPEQDPNICWELHVNTVCDPSNYERVTKKKKCPVPGCKELLTFSNTIKCRDCTIDHCLKHRFVPDHKCPGPKKPDSSFAFMGGLLSGRKEDPKPSRASATSSNKWGSGFLNAASMGMARLSNEISQAWQTTKDGAGQGSSRGRSGQLDECPQCAAKFSSAVSLVEHVKKVHEKKSNQSGVRHLPVDVCPKCSRGFRDPVALVEHVEKDHGGTSRA